MARTTKHLINVHTSTGTTAPTEASLYLGEIAVQHTTGDPALWIKVGSAETSTEYEKFIGETEITNLLNSSQILGSGYTYSGLPFVNSATTIADAYSALTKEVIESEFVVAQALNDLNDRALTGVSVNGVSAQVISNVAQLAIAEPKMILGSGYTYSGIPYVTSATSIADAYSALTEELIKDEKTTAAGLNDLNDRVVIISGAVGNIDFSEITDSIAELSASVVNNSDALSAMSAILLTVSATVEDNEYVTAQALNDLNDRIDRVSGSSSSLEQLQELSASVVDYIASAANKERVIAESLNDLNDRVLALSADNRTMSSAISALEETSVPTFSAGDNGKVLMVSGGTLQWVNPVNVYSGNGTPQSSLGQNGDIYLQI